jgi:hypothetical protein
MDLEDSYEGAVRRMQRLEAARPDMFEDQSDRMAELEELATLACEDNERLKAELASSVSELQGVRAALDATRREAENAYQENEQLRASVASLQQKLTGVQQQASAQRAAVWPPQPQPAPQTQPAEVLAQPQAQPAEVWPQQAETDPVDDEYLDYPPKPNRKPLLVVGAAALLVIGLVVFHPWDSGHLPVAAVAVPAKVEVTPPPPPPVVTAPAPVVATTVPKVAPASTIPKMAPPVAAPARVTKSRAAHKKAKHHAAAKHGAKAKSASAAFDDPLGGTDL